MFLLTGGSMFVEEVKADMTLLSYLLEMGKFNNCILTAYTSIAKKKIAFSFS